jgi:amidase
MDILFTSATEAAELVRDRQVSARELTEALLARIDAVNPALNAVVELRRADALARADAADDALARGTATGPLHGVPMTIKDSFQVAGLHTTWGNPAFAHQVADWDATVVRRLASAGAIVVGKSNVHFMLADFAQTANEVYGTTNNPWDVHRTPGGSSGGGAAALAAGLTFLEYGSDLSGSIRIPASFCGVYGLRPTAGLVPTTGFQPPGPPAPPTEMDYLSSVGPLARTAADLRLALAATAGPEAPTAYSWDLPAPRRRRLADFRVGVVLDHPAASPASDVAPVLATTVAALASAGATIVDGWPDGVDPARVAEGFGFHLGLFFAFQQGDPPPGTLADFVTWERHRMAVRAAWQRYFDDVDVFVCPTNFTAAFEHDHRPFGERMVNTPDGARRYDEQAFWITHPTLPGLPSVAAPVGTTAAGLPVGIQIIAPRYAEDTAITFAELLAEVTGGFHLPPGLAH